MMDPTGPLLLSRVQFGLDTGVHILCPTLTMALGWFLPCFRVRHAHGGRRSGARGTRRQARLM